MNKDDQAKKKHKKILNKARALGMAHEIKDDQVVNSLCKTRIRNNE